MAGELDREAGSRSGLGDRDDYVQKEHDRRVAVMSLMGITGKSDKESSKKKPKKGGE